MELSFATDVQIYRDLYTQQIDLANANVIELGAALDTIKNSIRVRVYPSNGLRPEDLDHTTLLIIECALEDAIQLEENRIIEFQEALASLPPAPSEG